MCSPIALSPECSSPSRLAAEGPDDQAIDRKVQQRRPPQIPGERSPGVQGQRGYRSIHWREKRSALFIKTFWYWNCQATWEQFRVQCFAHVHHNNACQLLRDATKKKLVRLLHVRSSSQDSVY